MNEMLHDIAWEIEQVNAALVYYEMAIRHSSDNEDINKYSQQITKLNKELNTLERYRKFDIR